MNWIDQPDVYNKLADYLDLGQEVTNEEMEIINQMLIEADNEADRYIQKQIHLMSNGN